jgi:hypothetical protein
MGRCGEVTFLVPAYDIEGLLFRVRIIFPIPLSVPILITSYLVLCYFMHWEFYAMSNFRRGNYGYVLHHSVLTDISCQRLAHLFDHCWVCLAYGFSVQYVRLGVGTLHAIIILHIHRFAFYVLILTWPRENNIVSSTIWKWDPHIQRVYIIFFPCFQTSGRSKIKFALFWAANESHLDNTHPPLCLHIIVNILCLGPAPNTNLRTPKQLSACSTNFRTLLCE